MYSERERNSKAGLDVLCFVALFLPNYLTDKGVAALGATEKAVNLCPML